MSTSRIEALLEKFYEGRSSLQEEEILRDFFRNQDVPAKLKSHQHLFAYYRNERQQELKDHGFEQKLTERLMDDQVQKPFTLSHPKRNRFLFVSGIAAGILLLIGLFFTFRHDIVKGTFRQTAYHDPEIALSDASEALLLVSGNLNNGLKHVERLTLVGKAMNNLELFNKFYQYQTLIINPDEFSNQSIKSK